MVSGVHRFRSRDEVALEVDAPDVVRRVHPGRTTYDAVAGASDAGALATPPEQLADRTRAGVYLWPFGLEVDEKLFGPQRGRHRRASVIRSTTSRSTAFGCATGALESSADPPRRAACTGRTTCSLSFARSRRHCIARSSRAGCAHRPARTAAFDPSGTSLSRHAPS